MVLYGVTCTDFTTHDMAVLWLRWLEVCIQSQLNSDEICAEQDGTGTDFLLVTIFVLS
jgi:long-subunit acyl-CoA synthetase (AMP-forming)